jgi:hypothetical protein
MDKENVAYRFNGVLLRYKSMSFSGKWIEPEIIISNDKPSSKGQIFLESRLNDGDD